MTWRPLLLLLLAITLAAARKHHLEIRADMRRYIPLSTFGFYEGGRLNFQLSQFRVEEGQETNQFGLSLDRTLSDAMNPYIDIHQTECIISTPIKNHRSGPIIIFTMDLVKRLVNISTSPTDEWKGIKIYPNQDAVPALRAKRLSDQTLLIHKRDTEEQDEDKGVPGMVGDEDDFGEEPEKDPMEIAPPVQDGFPALTMTMVKDGKDIFYGFEFVLVVGTKDVEGLYNLYFHSCPSYKNTEYLLAFNVDIEENNKGNFLSAGEMPLPALYFMMSVLFFLSGIFWVFLLRNSKHPVFKIHYLMAVLVFLKSMSLLFHAINYHFIEVKGEHVEAWAVLYYITHLMKGAVLFVTIILIGTGWTFIKHILADKDRRILVFVIPLQVLANVAEIIIAESEEGDKEHSTWRDIFILVDLLCCGCILFPVVWSIRHLQEASATDGKAAINLRKLKLFRQFYIMIVCYIYFTRIIIYLLKITVAFQYVWLDEMFREMATFVFFVLTGYKFRPISQHPYFSVEDESDDDEVEILTQTGVTEGLSKLTNRTLNSGTVVEVHDEEEKETLISKRESSHEYD